MANAILPYAADRAGNYTFHTPVNAGQIIELAASILREQFSRGISFSSPKDAAQFLQLELGTLEHEEFAVLFLDNRHRLISFERLFRGTIDGATVHPREVVKRALAVNAAAVILAHNHPSGVAEPSRADEALTRRLKDALALVDVRVLDHLVVSPVETVSMAERGLL
jgi:DNA repair protein RadC